MYMMQILLIKLEWTDIQNSPPNLPVSPAPWRFALQCGEVGQSSGVPMKQLINSLWFQAYDPFFFLFRKIQVRSNVISHRWSARRFVMKIPAFAPCARASDKVPPGGAWRDKNGENLKQKPRIQTTDRVKCCLSWLKQRRVETCWHPNIIYLEQYVGKVIVNHGV